MSGAELNLDGYAVVRLSSRETADLQDLHERCSDYYLLVEGVPTRPTSAEEDLADTPPGKSLSDKFMFGVYADRQMVGVLDLVRDHPAEREWWIGVLLLDPEARGSGLGSRLYGAAREWVRAQGGEAIHLSVLDGNPAAKRFWRRHGFQERYRKRFVAATGHASKAVVMSQRIAPPAPPNPG
jgi:ribosomal protein S18 acetylase RimI-like enzyme